MDAEAEFKKEYGNYLADFKTLSLDKTNDESLCQNTTHYYYNFDEIVKDRKDNLTPASPDTLIFNKDKVYCVEFKNQFKKRISTKIIKKKLENGHQVLSEIFTELGLKLKDYCLIFCVVHKGFDESKTEKKERKWQKIHYHIRDKRTIQFDLAQFKGKYYNDIFTNDVDFFRDQFIKKTNKSLLC